MTPTEFARGGRDAIIAEFNAPISYQAMDRALPFRTDAIRKRLNKAGYPKAFCYAEYYPDPDNRHGRLGSVLVTYDATPARGDGWSCLFELEPAKHHPAQADCKLIDFKYVPDVGVSAVVTA